MLKPLQNYIREKYRLENLEAYSTCCATQDHKEFRSTRCSSRELTAVLLYIRLLLLYMIISYFVIEIIVQKAGTDV